MSFLIRDWAGNELCEDGKFRPATDGVKPKKYDSFAVAADVVWDMARESHLDFQIIDIERVANDNQNKIKPRRYR